MSKLVFHPEDLSPDNFWAVFDLATEIQEKLELSADDELRIPVRVSVMYYEGDRQRNSLNRRSMSMEYLDKMGCFTNLRKVRTKYPTGEYYVFILDRPVFDGLFEHFKIIESAMLKNSEPKIEPEQAAAPDMKNEFVFDQAVLFRHGSTVVEKFDENTFEHELLRIAFKLPFGEQIDTMIDDFVDREWRTIYDAARRINDKVMARFGVADFFKIDFKNKFIARNIK